MIAGRDVLKILKVNDGNQIEESMNLRAGSRINLNLSCSDVKWNPHQSREHMIATAATNGSIIIWDISRSSGQRQIRLMTDHSRSVNRLSFHSTEPHYLLSASQDGLIKLWDLRSPSPSVGGLTFEGKSESVRDVQFCPNSAFDFASAFENGNIQIWDMRQPKIYQKRFGAHNGLVLSIDWQSDGRYLASGGRDKLVKVWDTRSDSRKAFHHIQTIASVARVSWRPTGDGANPFDIGQISSCSLLSDDRIHNWNLERSFMPCKSFDEHSNVVTGILWKDSDTLWSVSKDKSFVVRSCASGYLPTNSISATTLDWNLWDDLCGSSRISRSTANDSSVLTASACSKQLQKSDYPTMPSFPESRGSSIPAYVSMLINSNIEDASSAVEWAEENNSLTVPSLTDEESNQTTFGKASGGVMSSYFKRFPKKPSSNSGIIANLWPRQREIKLVHFDPKFYQATSIVDLLNDNDGLGMLLCSRAYMLPQNDSGISESEIANICKHNSVVCLELDMELDSRTWQMLGFVIENRGLAAAGKALDSESYLFGFFEDAIEHYCSSGDIQMAAMLTITMACFRRLPKESEDIIVRYRDFLQRANKYTEATEISRFSGIDNVKQLNQQSTSIHASCNMCFKPLDVNSGIGQRMFWYCDKCRQSVNPCSICDLPVKSVYTWCRECSHGGHLKHIKDWFSKNSTCPTGCGHQCKLFGET